MGADLVNQGANRGCITSQQHTLYVLPSTTAPTATLGPFSLALVEVSSRFASGRFDSPSGLVYFSGISTPEECGDMWRFGIHPILSNPLKYSPPKIFYHDGEFLI
jgi:hypothetical protein